MNATTATSPTRHRTSAVPDPATLAGAVVALGCTLVGQYVDTPWKSGPGEWGIDVAGHGGWAALALLIAMIGVGSTVTGLATARARAVDPERAARRALVLAALGFLTLVGFWTGLPAVLAGGATGLALDIHRRSERLPATAAVAVALAALTVAAAVYLAFAG
jgi:hypothetical protein